MNSLCQKCDQNSNLIPFPCQRFFCYDCIIKVIYDQLLSLKNSLSYNTESYTGKCSFFSCLNRCESCRLTISMNQVRLIAQKSSLTQTEKENFIKLSYLGQSFFEGIPTNFFECSRCNEITGAVNFFPFICKSCIKDLVSETTNVQLSDVIYSWCATQEDINNYDYMNKNFHILSYSSLSTSKYCFEYETIKEELYKKIFKPSQLSNEDLFIVARSIDYGDLELPFNPNFIYTKTDEDVQILCILRAII